MKQITFPKQQTIFVTDFEDRPVLDGRGVPLELTFKGYLLQLLSVPKFTDGLDLIVGIDYALELKKKIDAATTKLVLENDQHRRLCDAIRASQPDPRFAKSLREWMGLILDAETVAAALDKPAKAENGAAAKKPARRPRHLRPLP